MFAYGVLLCNLTMIICSGVVFAAPINIPNNPLTFLGKFMPKRTGKLYYPSSSPSPLSNVTAAASFAVRQTIKPTIRREVYEHGITSPPPHSSKLDEEFYPGNGINKTLPMHDLDAADAAALQNLYSAIHYLATKWQTSSRRTLTVDDVAKGDNNPGTARRMTATETNGRVLTGYPLSKDNDDRGPEEVERYYDQDVRPAEVWKTGLLGSLRSGQINSGDDVDDDDDDDEQPK